MTRSIFGALTLIGLLISIGHTTFAQTSGEPVDPLVRADEIAKQYELTLGLTYLPDGEEGVYVSERGLVTYTQSRHQVLLPIRLRYFLSASSSVLLSLNPGLLHTIVAESAGGDRTTSSKSETSISGSVGIRYRLAPQNELDPAITVSLQLPSRTADVSLSGSWIRDPIVLSGSLSHTLNMEANARYVALNVGTGLFLNDKIRFKAGAHHTARLDDVSLPQWGFSVGVVYALDAKGASDVYIGVSRTEHRGKSTSGLVVEWYRLLGSS